MEEEQPVQCVLCDVMCIWCLVQAYNMLAAQIEQNSSFGKKMDCKVLDVRDVDVRTCTHHMLDATPSPPHTHTLSAPFLALVDCHG